ncbi:MAG: universal stress protein, partial [Fimbriimonadales bacterium]|nr:universal stress protein [Fimbriimonadales bacterium]
GWRRAKQDSQAVAPPKRLLIPFSNTPDDRDALRFACEMAQVFDAHLTVLCLVEMPRSVGLESCPATRLQEGELVAAAAREIAEELGISEIETIIRPTHHCGYAIVSATEEFQTDLLFITARYRNGRARPVLDDTVEVVLRKARCQVWLYGAPQEVE